MANTDQQLSWDEISRLKTAYAAAFMRRQRGRDRTPGKPQPAGAKLSRMAAAGRIGKGQPR